MCSSDTRRNGLYNVLPVDRILIVREMLTRQGTAEELGRGVADPLVGEEGCRDGLRGGRSWGK